jgi:hypothetical protein
MRVLEEQPRPFALDDQRIEGRQDMDQFRSRLGGAPSIATATSSLRRALALVRPCGWLAETGIARHCNPIPSVRKKAG